MKSQKCFCNLYIFCKAFAILPDFQKMEYLINWSVLEMSWVVTIKYNEQGTRGKNGSVYFHFPQVRFEEKFAKRLDFIFPLPFSETNGVNWQLILFGCPNLFLKRFYTHILSLLYFFCFTKSACSDQLHCFAVWKVDLTRFSRFQVLIFFYLFIREIPWAQCRWNAPEQCKGNSYHQANDIFIKYNCLNM